MTPPPACGPCFWLRRVTDHVPGSRSGLLPPQEQSRGLCHCLRQVWRSLLRDRQAAIFFLLSRSFTCPSFTCPGCSSLTPADGSAEGSLTRVTLTELLLHLSTVVTAVPGQSHSYRLGHPCTRVRGLRWGVRADGNTPVMLPPGDRGPAIAFVGERPSRVHGRLSALAHVVHALCRAGCQPVSPFPNHRAGAVGPSEHLSPCMMLFLLTAGQAALEEIFTLHVGRS